MSENILIFSENIKPNESSPHLIDVSTRQGGRKRDEFILKKLTTINHRSNLYFIFLQDMLQNCLPPDKLNKLQKMIDTLIQQKNK